jgi:xylulokinase
MTEKALLALDLGTGSVKALVVDPELRVLGSASASYPVDRPRDGWAEQDPAAWWSSTVTVARSALAQAGSVEISAIGISGQMHGTVLLDEQCEPVRPAIIWEDRRSASQVRSLTERIGATTLIERCGSPIATGFQAATLAWLVEHEPESIGMTRTVLLPGDYLRFRLSGALATEPSDASSTLLFDIERRIWSPDVAKAVGIDLALLPPIAKSISITGNLTPGAAAAIGLPAGIPIAGGGADAPLAALAGSVTSSDTLLLTISTGSQAILPVSEPVVDLKGRIHTWCSLAEPGQGLPAWYQMGATLASGRALRWFRDEILAGSAPPLEQAVVSVPPGSDGLLFLPYLNGERTPHMDPEASGAFIGLRASHGPAEMSRAVMEGAAFSLLDAFDVLRDLGGAPRRIVLAGGGARSQTWTEIIANVFDLPVDPLEESEGSAMGAAIVAGTAIDWFDLSEGARRSARFGARVDSHENDVGNYRALHPIFQHAYQALADDFHQLGQIAARARSASINA